MDLSKLVQVVRGYAILRQRLLLSPINAGRVHASHVAN